MVQPFPATGVKWQVSAAGGFASAWRGDGREMFYVASDYQMKSVAVTPSAGGLTFGPPRPLFKTSIKRTLGVSGTVYVVSRDAQGFLMIERPREALASPMTVVVGLGAPEPAKR